MTGTGWNRTFRRRRERGFALGLAARTGLLAFALLITPVGIAGAEQREHGDVRLCAHVPDPGAPEGVAVAPDGTIYTATANDEGNGDTSAPSKVFAYSPSCKLLRSYQIEGQELDQSHGLGSIVLDAEGRLYITDVAPPRLLRLDPRTGRQEVYARLRDVPSCGSTAETQCEPGQDHRSIPDFLTFGSDGSLYVTDALQGLIWRIPSGGGKGRVWFKDPRIDPDLGAPDYSPIGIRLAPDGRTLVFSTIFQPISCACDVSAGRIWKLPIEPDGRPGKLKLFWQSGTFDGPIDFAFGRSAKLYVTLAGPSQLGVLSPSGEELERFPSPVENATLEVPMDVPFGIAFEGDRLIVSNNSFIAHNPSAWALLDVYIGESGAPTVRPRISGKARSRQIKLSVKPTRARAGEETSFHFRATWLKAGKARPVRGARIRFGKSIAYTGRRGRATITRRFRHPKTLHPHACKRGFRCGRAHVRVNR